MRCIKERCYSHVACEGFGYCRDRNENGLPSEKTANEWRSADGEKAPKKPNLVGKMAHNWKEWRENPGSLPPVL